MAEASWTDTERVQEYLHNNPGLAADLFTRLLGQTELDALYAKMFPPATDEEKLRALETARRLLARNGYEESGALVQELDSELATVRSALED